MTTARLATLPDATASRLHYCNSLLYNISKGQFAKLQRVQNEATRLILDLREYSHITPALNELQWLPVHVRIHFKILLLVLCLVYEGA